MLSKGVTLRGLEVFEALASSGSVAQTAQLTGLSQPAVSQQLRNLENALGIDLVDHGRRPMRLTPAGESFLARAEAALGQLRLAQSELTVMDLAHLSSLSLGIIDDFENDLTPRLVTILADSMVGCRFKLITAPSHAIIDMLLDKRLHIAISASAGTLNDGVVEYPIANDPFILVAPRGHDAGPDGTPKRLPFLRYEKEQLIGRQIEAHLARQKITFDDRFEVGSHLALMAMVASGIGWAITTPLGYMRAGRFHQKVEAKTCALRGLFATDLALCQRGLGGGCARDVATTMRRLVQAHIIEPALHEVPWLAGSTDASGGLTQDIFGA